MTPVRRLTVASLLAALITLSTLFLKVPGITGYYHLGDGFVFLAALILPAGVAAAAAAIGSALADVLSGSYVAWAPWTFVIKGLAALVVGLIGTGRSLARDLPAMFVGAFMIVAGYAVATWILYGWAAVPAETYFNLGQTGTGIVVAAVLVAALRRSKALRR